MVGNSNYNEEMKDFDDDQPPQCNTTNNNGDLEQQQQHPPPPPPPRNKVNQSIQTTQMMTKLLSKIKLWKDQIRIWLYKYIQQLHHQQRQLLLQIKDPSIRMICWMSYHPKITSITIVTAILTTVSIITLRRRRRHHRFLQNVTHNNTFMIDSHYHHPKTPPTSFSSLSKRLSNVTTTSKWQQSNNHDDHPPPQQQQQQTQHSPTDNDNDNDYTNATTVPISYLLKLLLLPKEHSNLFLQKIWIGTHRILFQTTTTTKDLTKNNVVTTNPSSSSWKHVPLSSQQPSSSSLPNSTLLSFILSLVLQTYQPNSIRSSSKNDNNNNNNQSNNNQSSNIELAILPEDLEEIYNIKNKNTNMSKNRTDYVSIIATAFVTCIPFVYLALVYRMIQKSSSSSSSPSIKDNHDIHSLIHTNSPTTTTKNGPNDTSPKNTTVVTFADVAGIDDAVRDMQQIVQYVQNPIRYQQYGANITRGILLHGPPGSGKTLLVRALSYEIQQQQHTSYGGACPVIACAASNFVELYVGRGAARVRQLFQLAKQRAVQAYHQQQQQYDDEQNKINSKTNLVSRYLQKYMYNNIQQETNQETDIASSNKNSCCCMAILFIDELDALAKTRSGGSSRSFPMSGGNDEREQTLNQLLTEMDGFHTSTPATNNGRPTTSPQPIIIVIGATNRVDVLDPAILRRFDRHIHVPYPDLLGRKQILQIHARHVPLVMSTSPTSSSTTTPLIDWDVLATMTHDMSGSDLHQIVNEAALLAVRECYEQTDIGDDHIRHDTNGSNNHLVTQRHLEQAIQRHRQRSGQVRK